MVCLWSIIDTEPDSHPIIHLLYTVGEGCKLITWFAQAFAQAVQDPLATTHREWEDNLGRNIAMKNWAKITEYPRWVSWNRKFQYIQHNILHRVYLIPASLSRMFSSLSECPRSQQSEECIRHMFWTCPEVEEYWTRLKAEIQRVSDCTVLHLMEGALLGLFYIPVAANASKWLIDLALVLTRRLLTMHWKPPTLPSTVNWRAATLKWDRAEAAALWREEILGFWKYPKNTTWETLLNDFNPHPETPNNLQEDA
ncbi:hypothetical protein NDU88_002042 [Pleurodeles waltl]|uniref:Reverse transcriptase zinc-binding domain-containing protein n=1 Tax=Pleurodeles waltl TaxID=8319 RepID=A0AAV7NE88_PLEWA|nr:hypothetical protein NDU88_002042 [Pleurodeles waltl]